MTKIGIVGIGFMGMIHYLAARRASGAEVVAIATRDPKKRSGDWTSIQGNFGPRGKHEDLSGVAAHASIDDLLADENVDLVDICLPNDQHAEAAIKALRAGKNVLVEKAIALNLSDADKMVAAAAEANRLLLVAHVLPFFPDFRFMLDVIADKRFGELRAAHFRRHISPPNWSEAIASAASSGGPIVDLHIHDTHFIALACGRPEAVRSIGTFKGDALSYVSTQYLYGVGGPIVSATSGAISAPSRPFTHGFEAYFDDATLFFEAGEPLVVYGPEGRSAPDHGEADPVDAFTMEIEYAAAAVSSKGPTKLLSGQLGRDALALCLNEAESVRSGQAVAVR